MNKTVLPIANPMPVNPETFLKLTWIEQGLYEIPEELYHPGPGLSIHGLKEFSKSPAHYITSLEEEGKRTDALDFGSALHAYAFTPTDFYIRFEIIADTKRRTPQVKEEAAENNMILIRQRDFDKIRWMVDAVYLVPDAPKLADGPSLSEVSGYWQDPEHLDVLSRMRIDYYNIGLRTIVDLKSCVDSFKYEFSKSILNYNYYWQAAYYLFGMGQITNIPHEHFIFIAVEKEKPFQVHLYKADQEMIVEAIGEYRPLIEKYAECKTFNTWPKADGSLQEISLPGFKKRRRDMMLIN